MRNCVFVAATLWLTPVIAVGLTGVGLAQVAAIVIGFVLAAAIGKWASGPLAATLSPALAGRRALMVVVMLLAAVGIVQIARESVFMADNTKPGIVTQHTAKLCCCFISTIGNYNHTGMYAVTHAHTASVVKAHPTCTAGSVHQCI